jgi:hypothetical protein
VAFVCRAQLRAAAADPVVLLEKLAALHDRGLLSYEEFQQQKRRLLGPAEKPGESLTKRGRDS